MTERAVIIATGLVRDLLPGPALILREFLTLLIASLFTGILCEGVLIVRKIDCPRD
jgi:hypothetical protein